LCLGPAAATTGGIGIVTRSLAQRFVIAICILAIMFVPLASVAPTVASDTPNSFHWARKPSQFTVQAVSNVDGVWNKLLDDAIDDWNKSDTVTIKEKSGSHGRSQDCSPSKGKIEVCNWNYGTQDGWLGLTRLFFDNAGNHVEAATVQMNDSFFNQKNGDYNNNNARLHTICHEMGHAIGLDHADSNSCLNHDPDPDALASHIHPTNKDYNQLEKIYKHKDSSTTLAGKQKDGKKDKKGKKGKRDKDKKRNKNKDKKQDDQDKRENRKERRRDRAESEGFFDPTSLPAVPSGLQGDETVTVQSMDDGTKVVTFITWADE